GSAHVRDRASVRVKFHPNEPGYPPEENLLLRIDDIYRSIRPVGDVISSCSRVDVANIEIVQFVARYRDGSHEANACSDSAPCDCSKAKPYQNVFGNDPQHDVFPLDGR